MWPLLARLTLAQVPEVVSEPAAAPPETTVPPSPAPVADPELEALKARLAVTEAQLVELQRQIADTRIALIPKDAMKLTFEGHYRARGSMYGHLYASQTDAGKHEAAKLFTHRLLLRPKFDYKDVAKLFVEFRALDDMVWGDNASLASTALFAGSPSNTDLAGQEAASVDVSRVWVEANAAVGVLRVGRQPSQWGMGLLANSGDTLNYDFGDAHYPTTSDRALFATRPFAIYNRITGKGDGDVPLIVAVAVDRLVEDPLFQFYGFECTAGLLASDPNYDARCDADADGVSDQDHSYQDNDYLSENRPEDWWADQNDDVQQMVYVLVYRGTDVDLFGHEGDLTAGVYIVNRHQDETESDVWVADANLHLDWRGILVDFEGITITGDTRGITLPSGEKDPLQKTAKIWGWVARGGYRYRAWQALMEAGFASGDDNVTDPSFTGRPLHPDHNVGLLLYEEVLSRVTAAGWTESAKGLWSNGGVYNSLYINPRVHFYPMDNWDIVGGFLTAWPDKADGAVIRCVSSDRTGCATPASDQATASTLGWEVDAAIKHTWYKHIGVSLEGGYLKTTDRIPLETAGLDEKAEFWTMQSRFSYQF